MATVELTAENFNWTVTGDGLVLVDFWAEWCPPCRMFGPVFEKASEKHPDAVFGKVDTEAQPETGHTSMQDFVLQVDAGLGDDVGHGRGRVYPRRTHHARRNRLAYSLCGAARGGPGKTVRRPEEIEL